MRYIFLALSACFILFSCETNKQEKTTCELKNPIIPGYFADPSIVEHEGKFYMYATADPWGAEFLSCWESEDFQNWTFNKLNWPTKEACTSPTSNENNVWAPSVVKKGDAFYMYISVGSEIWCGKADHPLGPWKNMLEDKPMIAYDTTKFYHVIDAEAFIDDDGKSYLYWGSGWDWINGHCFAAELNDDMSSFKTEPVEVTPPHYFEGPLMFKHNDKYYLTYSEGKTIDDTYEVRYATGESPLGPFEEAPNSPILKTTDSLQVYGPGHHTIFTYDSKNYILYHRHSLPFVTGTAMRQICINELEFDEATSQIKTIIPHHKQAFPDLAKNHKQYIIPESVSASSESSEYTLSRNVTDNDYSTRWEAAQSDTAAYLISTFNNDAHLNTMEIRFEYPWKSYFINIASSEDGENWKTIADYTENGISGSPVLVDINSKCKHIRILFSNYNEENRPSVWELKYY